MALARRPACAFARTGSIAVRQFSDDALATLKAQTHISVNAGGRQSISGITATCFGASGFLGSQVVQKLGRVGSDVIVPYRGDGNNIRKLKVMGDLGKIVPLPYDFTKEETLRLTMLRSNVVINMIGNRFETRNYSFHDTNVKLVHRLCKVTAEMPNVKRFIHVSALGADLKSPSAFLRTKAEGELVVRDFFPHATILRPAPMYGEEDTFLGWLAGFVNASFIVPMLGNGEQKLQPISGIDVAMAVVAACVDSDAPGRTYELGGPEVVTKKELLKWVSENVNLPEGQTILLPTSLAVCKLLAKLLQFVPNQHLRALTPDQVDQALVDLVVSKDAYKVEDLGIKPFRLAEMGPTVLMHHFGNRNIKSWDLPKGDPRGDRLRVGA